MDTGGRARLQLRTACVSRLRARNGQKRRLFPVTRRRLLSLSILRNERSTSQNSEKIIMPAKAMSSMM